MASSQHDRLLENMGRDVKSLSAKGVVEKTRKEYSDHTLCLVLPCLRDKLRRVSAGINSEQVLILVSVSHIFPPLLIRCVLC